MSIDGSDRAACSPAVAGSDVAEPVAAWRYDSMINGNNADDLSIDLDDLPCPACDSPYAQIARILAPEEIENATAATFGGTTTGAAGGAALGSLAGPAGTVVGGAVGALVGGSVAKERQEKRRVILECPECGYYGDALGNERAEVA